MTTAKAVPKNGIWCYRCHRKKSRKHFWVKGLGRGFYSMYCHPCTKAVDEEMAAKERKDCGCYTPNGDTWVFCDRHNMNIGSQDSSTTRKP